MSEQEIKHKEHNEIVSGYYSGVHNNPWPKDKSESFKLGWCAGMFDGWHLTKAEAMAKLR